MKRPKFSLTYALVISGIVVLALLVVDFNQRMAALRNLSVQKVSVSARLAGLQQTQVSLQTQIAYATSDAAVEDWAYVEGNMVRPGDNPVVPLPPPGSTPAPTPTPRVVVQKVENWQMWMWLFFDTPPEGLGSP
jgi:hypothetical protein